MYENTAIINAIIPNAQALLVNQLKKLKIYEKEKGRWFIKSHDAYGKEKLVSDENKNKKIPEEIVRQLFLFELTDNYDYQIDKIKVEEKVSFGRERKRADIVVYQQDGITPWILVEVKKRVENYYPEKFSVSGLAGQSENIKSQKLLKKEYLDKKNRKKETKEITPADSSLIGRWGEKYVLEYLKEEYQKLGSLSETENGFIARSSDNNNFEIIWLNKHQDKGTGCDFIIKKNNLETKYIEVKSKTHEKDELIEVTGTQWEFARSLYDKREGDKYFFFVVVNAGKKDTVSLRIIQNPIKLWKEGKLYVIRSTLNYKKP